MKAHSPGDFTSILAELREGTDRATILVGAALLEHMLERCIVQRLQKARSKSEQKLLFSSEGLFESFYGKITAAYFLKIIGPRMQKYLNNVRRIRNEAAHDVNFISFETSAEIARLGRDLGELNPKAPLRKIFIGFVEVTFLNMVNRANSPEAEIPSLPPTLRWDPLDGELP